MNRKIFVDAEGHVFLKRENKHGRLHIATLKGDVLIVTKKPGHLYYSTNSYGFNLEMVTALPFNTLRVIELPSGAIFETTKGYLLHRGIKYEHESYELQIFLPLKEFGLQKAIQFEEAQARKQKVRSITMYEGLAMMGIKVPPRRQS